MIQTNLLNRKATKNAGLDDISDQKEGGGHTLKDASDGLDCISCKRNGKTIILQVNAIPGYLVQYNNEMKPLELGFEEQSLLTRINFGTTPRELRRNGLDSRWR